MANQEHLDILKQGVEAWNQWRQMHHDIKPDLSEATLSRANLSGNSVDRTIVDWIAYTGKRSEFLSKLYAQSINLSQVNLRGADLSESNLSGANLSGADLSYANLYCANLYHANLTSVNFASANLEKADLGRANLIEANLEDANLTGCHVYGISVWDIKLSNTTQSDLIITRYGEASITVDNLEVAQFIYLLLNNQKIRDIIDTITSKVALILGRFTDERKAVLNALRDELRKRNYSPILFDFDKPASRDLTETITTLAHLARFIIVDLTDPSSAPHEVATIIPQTVVPVQPLLTLQPLIFEEKALERHEYAMFEDLRRRYHWVLPTFRYQDTTDLLASLHEHIIDPAEEKAKELAKR